MLYGVPNQPTYFADDGWSIRRKEDDFIAKTWELFLRNTSNTEMPLRNPMVKAAVRAMDAAQEYLLQKTGQNVTRFLVAGASKRGWTSWITAAVDDRVVALVPCVMSLLN